MATCLISLGSNLGDRQSALDEALALLAHPPDVRIVACSAPYRTAPIGGPPGQGEFLNAAAVVETLLSPQRVLARLLDVEQRMGRRRAVRWDARRIDLDILLYDDLVLKSSGLTVPHPRMTYRRFVLAPAAEVAPGLIHPQLGRTIERLLHHLNTTPNYAALIGEPGAGKTVLARQLATQSAADWLADSMQTSATPDRGGSSGELLQRELEFVLRRSSMLRDRFAHASPAGLPGVSDFWLEQSLAYASLTLEEDEWRRFAEQFEPIREETPQPRLLIVMHSDEQHAGGTEAARHAGPAAAKVRQKLHDLARRPNMAPVLELEANQPTTACTEAVAAIMAMQ